MTKQEKKVLLQYITWLQSQKSFLEAELSRLGFPHYLSKDFTIEDHCSSDYATFLLGEIQCYRGALSVINSYFCYHGTDSL